MTSTFAALWRYARAERAEALENFSTEALAAAIRSDWRPFISLLRGTGLIETALEPTEVQVVTQKPVAGGSVDLAAIVIGPDWSREVWLEVKVGSGIHGNQIETYLRAIAERGTTLPTRLGFLTKSSISDYPDLARVTWREVGQAAACAHLDALLWHDLAKYLEEVGVTDAFDEPITQAEATAMLEGARLLRKMRRLLRQTSRDARARWPALTFPEGTGVADRFVEQQFADHARLSIGTRGGRANVLMGLVQREATIDWAEAEPQAAVWMEHQPRATEVRRQLIEAAGAGGLAPEWKRSWKGYWALLRHEPVGAFDDLAAIRDWWFARIAELDASGLIDILPRLGASTQEDQAAVAEDAAIEAELAEGT